MKDVFKRVVVLAALMVATWIFAIGVTVPTNLVGGGAETYRVVFGCMVSGSLLVAWIFFSPRKRLSSKLINLINSILNSDNDD